MNTSHRRKFSDDEKRRIVNEALIRGINVILQEHRLSYSVFSRWKKKFHIPTAIDETKKDRTVVQQFNNVMIENGRLKKIIADLLLDIQEKNEKIKEFTSRQNNNS